MNSNNSSLNNSLKNTKNQNPNEFINNTAIKMTINSGQHKSEDIIVTKYSKPEELAYNFCHNNNLDYKTLNWLIKKIKIIQENHFFNKKNIFKTVPNTDKTKDINNNQYNISTEELQKTNSCKIRRETNLEILSNNGLSSNNRSNEYDKYNTINSNNPDYPLFSIYNQNLIKNNNKKDVCQYNISLLKNRDINNINTIFNNSTNKIIRQTIKRCLEIVENEDNPFCSESNSEINKDSKISKLYDKSLGENGSEIKSGSFSTNNENNITNNKLFNHNNNANYFNEEKIISLNTNKDISHIKEENKYYNENNNNYIEDEILLDKESFLSNNKININIDNSLNNEIQISDHFKDNNLNISKTESNNLTKNIINNSNDFLIENKNNSIKKEKNKNLIVSESINVNIPSSNIKETNLNTIQISKIPYNNDYKDNLGEKLKALSKSSKIKGYIPKINDYEKIDCINKRSDSIKNKNISLLKLLNDSYNQMNNFIGKKYKQSPIIYGEKKNNNFNDKEIECTPSTYIKSCKNSLSSLAVSDKNLISAIKENNLKSGILNLINNAYKNDDLNNFHRNSNSNALYGKNNKFVNRSKLSQNVINSNSLNLKPDIINEELENNINNDYKNGNYTIKKENKTSKYISLLENYHRQNKKFNHHSINNYHNRTEDIKEKKNNKINKKYLLFNNNNEAISGFSNESYVHQKNQTNFKSNNINYHLSKKKCHISNKTEYIINDNLKNNLFKRELKLPQTSKINRKTRKYFDINFLTNNIISKNEIEDSFKNIFRFLTKNNNYLDAFSAMNTKTIPSKIYKPIQSVIKSCNNKKRFISENEFVKKGYELFNFFSQNDKISIINFNIF